MANRAALLMAIAVVVAALAAVKASTLSFGDEPRDSNAARQRVAIVTQGMQDDPGSPILELRFRIEWVGAGNGYRVGTGTWEVVRGTGRYSHITGGGLRGDMWLKRGRGPWTGRAEGFLVSSRP